MDRAQHADSKILPGSCAEPFTVLSLHDLIINFMFNQVKSHMLLLSSRQRVHMEPQNKESTNGRVGNSTSDKLE